MIRSVTVASAAQTEQAAHHMPNRARKEAFNVPLHGLRGLASLLVLVGHVLGGYNNQFLGGADNWLSAVNHVGTFGVELFFVLSGYVILNSIKKYDLGNFVEHRFWRIYPVFLCFTLIYSLGNSLLQIDSETNSVAYLLANLTFLDLFLGTPPLSPNAWTITYEVWFYLLSFALLKPIFESKDRWIAMLAGVLCLVFAFHFPLTMYFVAGALINMAESRLRSTIDKLSALAVGILEFTVTVALVLILAQEKLMYGWSAILSGWRIPTVFVLTTLFFIFAISQKSIAATLFRRKALLAAGTISYSLYLSHPYPHFVLKRLIGEGLTSLLPNTASAIPFLVGVLILALPFAYLVHRFVETPLYRLTTGRTIYPRP